MRFLIGIVACLISGIALEPAAGAQAQPAQPQAQPAQPPQGTAGNPPGIIISAQPILRKLANTKFAPLAVLPPCVTLAVESGDPMTGPSMLLFKTPAGCRIPWHWHTPNEHVMLVSGTVNLEMREGTPSTVLGPGSYAMLPSKHVHQFTCVSNCMAFLFSDATFDIHYVDAEGNEIPLETAIGKAPKTKGK